jgi:hypothetical protein
VRSRHGVRDCRIWFGMAKRLILREKERERETEREREEKVR